MPGVLAARPVRRRAAAEPPAQIDGLLDAVPPYFSQGVITPDRRTATLAFGIRLMPLDRAAARARRHARASCTRPPGVRAQLAGLPVLAAEANAAVVLAVAARWLTLLAGLLAVALVLLVALRALAARAVPLVPIALATGWSALVLFALRIPLNPMSVTLGALVIAISTEFSVLLSRALPRRARAPAHDAGGRRSQRTYRSTGAAVLASGVTAIAGFAVLVVSDIRDAARLRLRHGRRPRPSRCSACWSCCRPCSCSPSGAPRAARAGTAPRARRRPARRGAGAPRDRVAS